MIFTEVLWCIFFFSSCLLLLVCIALLALGLLARKMQSNKSSEDEKVGSSVTK